MCLCLSDGLRLRRLQGQDTGGLSASDRNPAQDACCILIRLQGEAGGGCVGGGNTSGSSDKLKMFSENSGLARVSCCLNCLVSCVVSRCRNLGIFSLNEFKSLCAFVHSQIKRSEMTAPTLLSPCWLIHSQTLDSIREKCSSNGCNPNCLLFSYDCNTPG